MTMQDHSTPEISVLVPMRNEVNRIEKCVEQIEYAVRSFVSYEVIIAEDGSKDGTARMAKDLARNNPRVRLLHSSKRLGKGAALKWGIRAARGKIIVFMDADLSTDLRHLLPFAKLTKGNCGMTIGSRYVQTSETSRPKLRTVFSYLYNLLARFLFADGVRDHQCGFKAMESGLARMLANEVRSNDFFADTEMIVRAKKRGFQVTEVGVKWTEFRERGESKVTLTREALFFVKRLLELRLDIIINGRCASFRTQSPPQKG